MIDETAIRGRFEALRPRLDERGRRLFCAAEARTAGYGGGAVGGGGAWVGWTPLGDPMRPLLWVSKSHAKLAQALRERGHRVSASRIPQWLDRLGYRRQVKRKSLEGGPPVARQHQ